MPLAAALALALAAAADDPVQAAVEAALAWPGARAEIVALRGGLPAGCALRSADVPRAIASSGRAAVRLSGRDAGGPCQAWVWAEVRLLAPALVLARAVREGEPLQGAVATDLREVAPGRRPLSELPEGALATRPLAAGALLEPGALRAGPVPGERVTVVVAAGTLRVERQARALPCRAGHACALLPTGRRVEGAWHGGRILLESP
jgi:hypothetical protein